MDKTDHRLLAALQRNAKTSVQALSDLVGASTASVQRRLKALRESGVIRREVAVLDQKRLGFDVTAVVAVDLERDRLDQIQAFKRKARNEPQVSHCYCIAGDADFILVVLARDMADYEAFTHRFFFADQTVRKFRTSIVVSTEKATLDLPLGG